MQNNTANVLTIAGSDSSGGAGIQADIKTISALGCYAASVITALTAQNTLGVQAIYDVSPQFVCQQLESILPDITIHAIKIGMLHNEKVIAAVASMLQKFNCQHVVLDPVMLAKNGCALIDENALHALKKQLFPLVTVLTPNILEAEKLLQKKIISQADQASAAQELSAMFNKHVLVKGGHLAGEMSSDVVYDASKNQFYWFHAKRIDSKNTHGTGCSLSSAIAAYLAKDYPLLEAVEAAKKYITNAIEFGQSLHIGQGCGPLNHFYFLPEIAHV